MKKRILFAGPILSCKLLSCFLLLALLMHGGCKKGIATKDLLPQSQMGTSAQVASGDTAEITEDQPLDEIVVWLKPGRSQEEFRLWLAALRRRKGQIEEVSACRTCGEGMFVMLKGTGIKSYICDGGTVSGGTLSSASTDATGEDGPVWVSRNYRVKYARPFLSASSPVIRPARTRTGTPVKVAVFDTGVLPDEIEGFSFVSPGPSCIPGAENGYNFMKRNADFIDNNEMKHGTTVASFITGQVEMHGQSPVEILPVKTHTRKGVSDLAGVLCALIYAKERGVRIINASFGFYAPRLVRADLPYDPNVRLFREFIRHFLTKNNILLVAAAGNRDDKNEKAAFDLYGLPYPDDPRNLDQVAFYPAAFAGNPDLPNVIAVTTVDRQGTRVSPNQNYSCKVVDIGVRADRVIRDPVAGELFVFNNPRLAGNETAEGSSFAAPIVAGKLCAYYHKWKHLLNEPDFSKEKIWRALGRQVVDSNENLKEVIRYGLVMDK